VLELWAERVWKPESLTIVPILERDAEVKRQLIRELPIDRFIPTATNGVEFAPRPGIDRVVMVPSFVNRPLVSYMEFSETLLIVYPVADESVTAESDAPPLRLVRLSKALGDEKRLRILRALADGEKSLMELAEMFGVAKTTMHHHMLVLRSAGLISVTVGTKRYRLRPEAVPDVGALLSGYLGAASGPSAASRPPAASPSRRRKRTGTEG
jgi:DNA-binding transcriptional ArsR family regulator